MAEIVMTTATVAELGQFFRTLLTVIFICVVFSSLSLHLVFFLVVSLLLLCISWCMKFCTLCVSNLGQRSSLVYVVLLLTI